MGASLFWFAFLNDKGLSTVRTPIGNLYFVFCRLTVHIFFVDFSIFLKKFVCKSSLCFKVNSAVSQSVVNVIFLVYNLPFGLLMEFSAL